MVHSTSKNSTKKRIIFFLIFFFCFFIQILPVIRSGLNYNYGLGFWGSNGHDAIWHLSLINSIKNPLKIILPIFAGETLKNYHPFFDILIAFFSNITRIPSIIWYFQIFPLISTFILLLTSFFLGRKITSTFKGGILLMFFNSLANSFGWLVSLFKTGQISGESLFWSMQSASNQLNPPFTLSLIFINLFLLLILNKTIKFKVKSIFFLLILILTPITKAYGGVVVYSIFAFYSLFSFKKDKKPFILFLISLPLAYLVFTLYNSTSTSLFIFKPFWFINSLVESPDRLYIPFLANMRYTLEASGRIGPRLIVLYCLLTGVFYLGNFSWRLFGLFSIKSFKSKIKLPLLLTIFITALIPLFFIQKGTSWNTIQFLYYSLFLSNIFLVYYFSKGKLTLFKKTLLIIVITTTVVSNYETIARYLSNPAPAALPKAEIEALNFLKSQDKGIVLAYPYDKHKKDYFDTTPIPLYAYETTAYISAFSKQISFLEDEMNLSIIGFDWSNRRLEIDKFFNSQDKYFARGFLLNNNIDYIYLVNDQNFKIDPEDLHLNIFFKSDQVKIYKVRK